MNMASKIYKASNFFMDKTRTTCNEIWLDKLDIVDLKRKAGLMLRNKTKRPTRREEMKIKQSWYKNNQELILQLSKALHQSVDNVLNFLYKLTFRNFSKALNPNRQNYGDCKVPLSDISPCDLYMGIFDGDGNVCDTLRPACLSTLLGIIQYILNEEPDADEGSFDSAYYAPNSALKNKRKCLSTCDPLGIANKFNGFRANGASGPWTGGHRGFGFADFDSDVHGQGYFGNGGPRNSGVNGRESFDADGRKGFGTVEQGDFGASSQGDSKVSGRVNFGASGQGVTAINGRGRFSASGKGVPAINRRGSFGANGRGGFGANGKAVETDEANEHGKTHGVSNTGSAVGASVGGHNADFKVSDQKHANNDGPAGGSQKSSKRGGRIADGRGNQKGIKFAAVRQSSSGAGSKKKGTASQGHGHDKGQTDQCEGKVRDMSIHQTYSTDTRNSVMANKKRISQRGQEMTSLLEKVIDETNLAMDVKDVIGAVDNLDFAKKQQTTNQKQIINNISNTYTKIIGNRKAPPRIETQHTNATVKTTDKVDKKGPKDPKGLNYTGKIYYGEPIPILLHEPFDKTKPWTWIRRDPHQLRINTKGNVVKSNIQRYQRESIKLAYEHAKKLWPIYNAEEEFEEKPMPMFG